MFSKKFVVTSFVGIASYGAAGVFAIGKSD